MEALSSLPGVGFRGAIRLVLYLLRQPSENIHHFAESIRGLADDLHYCKTCMMVCDGESCEICSDSKRDHNTICVVENVRDVMRIEESGSYNGLYHVLGGIISPINGVGPSDLTIGALVERLKAMDCSKAELIFALSGSVEGETTAFYIFRQIESLGLKVTTLARGLSFGADLEYADTMTLGRSITERQVFKG